MRLFPSKFTVAFAALLPLALAKNPWDCVSGINEALSSFTFGSDSATLDDYYVTVCQNRYLIASQWAAAKLYCTPEEIVVGQQYLNDDTCLKYGGIELVGYDEVKGNLTDEFIKNLTVVGFEDIKLDAGTVFNRSILVEEELVNIAIRTVVSNPSPLGKPLMLIRNRVYGPIPHWFIRGLGKFNSFLAAIRLIRFQLDHLRILGSSIACRHPQQALPKFSVLKTQFKGPVIRPLP